MKRRLGITLAILLLSEFLFASVKVNNIYYELDDVNRTAFVTNPDVEGEYAGNIVIPASILYNDIEYAVTGIGTGNGQSATMLGFTNCTNLSEITIPNSVKLIGTGAFYGCTGLTKVNISEGVETIGYRAFYGCSQLTEVTIPNSATKLWGGIFEDCTGLTKVTFPENVDGTTNDGISNYLFRNCSSLTEVSLPNGFKILRNTFDGCSNLKNVTIPNSVTSIESNVFRGCIGLTSITIPNSVTSIGSYAFNSCTGLASVTIGEGVTSIGSSAFKDCRGLTSITIPNGVTNIGASAFAGCTGLKEVINKSELNITKGYATNGYVAYYADIVYNGDKTVIGDFIFSDRDKTLVKYTGNGGAITLPENFNGDNYIIKDNVFSGNSTLTSVTIPSSVTSIGASAFSGCCGLTSVTIPSSVTNIGASAFAGCSGLTEIICEGETPAGSNTIFGEGGEAGKIYVKALLKVPSQWFKLYKVTEPWCRFDMTASDFDMVVIPYENKAVFTWTPITGAEAYELTVIEKETGEALCSLNFDAYGRLRGLVLRNDSEKTYVGGYDFTVTSLRGDVEYDYTMEVKDISDNVIESMSGTFRTSGGAATAAPEAEESIVETARYDINGRPLNAPTKGVNIVKYSDGSFEKEFVK